MSLNIIKHDPYLEPYTRDLENRLLKYQSKRSELLQGCKNLSDFANGYEYFGIHKTCNGWVYREWAPGADKMFFCGDFNNWNTESHPMTRLQNGVFEIFLEGKDTLRKGMHIQAIVIKDGELMRRIPSYATRVVQDEHTHVWCAQVDDVLWDDFKWEDSRFQKAKVPFIYECHIGMATEEYKIGSYKEFEEKVLPKIKELGYNTIQIMAIQEHPYYASFGYQVSNFFAPSSRYGTGSELKSLINTAHKNGIAVLLDVVHSHAVKNEGDGLNRFDGTDYQYFHEGVRGHHPAWDTKLFNYGKNEVLHFLLSNLKYWMKVFHFDGFRFDGVTSMLYFNHGLESAFCDYSMYFSENTDEESIVYLQLANELIHSIKKSALTIAEDMSGMPGMCVPIKDGGIGFDYRLSMGVPDLFIKLIKEYSDENWDMFKLMYELKNRRPLERNIGYCESHDQALVGDKTLIFRLCDANMYWNMNKESADPVIDRGMALHKMIRLITASLAGEGYLNFMGNEFGHPEWIDFPREGNGWSYHHCRRQWSLAENNDLRYSFLNEFDKEMISLLKRKKQLETPPHHEWIHGSDKVVVYTKGSLVYVFNFNPESSFEGYFIPVEKEGAYKAVLSTDEKRFGGFDRVSFRNKYKTFKGFDGKAGFLCYLPARTATVFELKNL